MLVFLRSVATLVCQRSIVKDGRRRAMHEAHACLLRGAGVFGDDIRDDEIVLAGRETGRRDGAHVHPGRGGGGNRAAYFFGVKNLSVCHISLLIDKP